MVDSLHSSKINTQLSTAMRSITDTLKSTPTEWLSVLSNVGPPILRRKLLIKKFWIKYGKYPKEYGQTKLFKKSSRLKRPILKLFNRNLIEDLGSTKMGLSGIKQIKNWSC